MKMPEIVWESYHSDGRPRNTPLPSTVHGWLTKMRGTLLDNEAMRYRGIKEMKQATVVRVSRKKEDAERKLREAARIKAGRSPLKTSAKQPWLRVSFLRNRPKPISGTSSRPAPARKSTASSAHSQRRKPPSSSRSRRSSASGRRNSGRPPTSRKSSHASHTSKRSSRK